MRLVFAGSVAALMSGCQPMSNPAPLTAHSFALPNTTTATDLVAYRAQLATFTRVGGHSRVRLAASGSCPSPCGTVVTIEAYDWTKDVPPNGLSQGMSVPVAHITNNGPYTTEMYSLKTSDIAEYEVYATSNSSNPGITDFTIEEVPATRFGIIKTHVKGSYNSCHHNPAQASEADFRPCDLPHASLTRSILNLASSENWEALVARAMTGFITSFHNVTEDPGWLSCTAGCCTLNAS